MPNSLARSTSPYLRQHADNPVDWYEWSDEALALAASRDVPVLLSVGYATCHWCHVMAHESFEDPETAAFMNDRFVNIKVDREERPDIDRIYMDAVTAVSGRGGWPMTVFLTPGAEPIYAGTYYPKTRMGNHPSFVEVMAAVSDAWVNNRSGVEDQARQITTAISQQGPSGTTAPSLLDIEQAIGSIAATYDEANGGFGHAPKFPQAPTLELLLRMATLRPGTAAANESLRMLEQTLAAMASGGIYDHLMGGFARYSVDAGWLIPHFEKMLYDNALLARLYLRTWQLTGNEAFKTTATEVLDYLDGPLADPSGGLHSGDDADSEGEEGKFAVWSWTELEAILGDDLPLAAALYGATQSGNFEGNNNLHRKSDLTAIAAAFALSHDDVASAKERVDKKLRTVRSQREAPFRDDKVVTAWNGFALRSFAEAAAILQEPRYLERAESIARFLLAESSPQGRLVRSWRDHAGHDAFADDFASAAIGLYTLFSVTGDARWFESAEDFVAELRSAFADETGGFFATRSDAPGLITRPKNVQDNPTPSDNALALEALLMHSALTGDLHALEEAKSTVASIATTTLNHPGFGGHGLAVWLTHLVGIKEVALVGEDTSDMQDVVWSSFRPDVVLAVGTGEASVVPLLSDRPATDGSVAYVCEGLVCDLPTHSPADLEQQLSQRADG
ncbi:MAG: thioredoxin domain-containing protein [Acidimicrobiia bacterium]